MSCSCHINPPCSYCMGIYSCEDCLKEWHEDDSPSHTVSGKVVCDDCYEEMVLKKVHSPEGTEDLPSKVP